MFSVAAGIILYNPELARLKENIEAVYNQVELLVLIDNASDNIDLLEKEYSHYENIVIIKNQSNLGIAAALNQVMSFCESKGYNWVLTLDQDSVCPKNMIEEYKKYVEIPDIAIIAPVIVDRNMPKGSIEEEHENGYELIEECITSASLTNVAIWKAVGCFDEEMFIDVVDFDYCKRAVLKGYKIIKVCNVRLLHEMGNITHHKLFLREVHVANHSAFRKYYMARNMLYYSKKYGTLASILATYVKIFKIILVTLLYEQNKCKKVCKMLQGICDAKRMIKKY